MNHIKSYKIFESKSERANVVRSIVRDIVNVMKTELDGEYTLPSHLTPDEDFYNFPSVGTEFSVELTLTQNGDIKDFELDGGCYEGEDTIEITIEYNPDKMPQALYNLIGYLNEVIRHELDHLMNPHIEDNRIRSSEKYYTQPHEIKAQVSGFKRLAKLRNQPFEDIVREWFYKTRNRMRHRMNNRSIEKVVKKIIDYEKTTRGEVIDEAPKKN